MVELSMGKGAAYHCLAPMLQNQDKLIGIGMTAEDQVLI